ncbi:hypothetical protein EP7_001558 [Isosphaeraceae bacterium EP7]
MIRRPIAFATLAAGLAFAMPAQAQFGGYGWGGWGGASTAQGDYARGMGMFAEGAGIYNQQTAVANSINADTAMRFNQYLWESQQTLNQERQARVIRTRNLKNESVNSIAKRLRENPSTSDIHSGDAMNSILDELNNPKLYVRGVSSAKQTVPGTLIREIPFQKAAAMITASYDELTKGGPPDSLKTPEFEAERTQFRAIAAKIRKEEQEQGNPNVATVDEALEIIRKTRAKVETVYPNRTSRQRQQADRFLKATYGLLKMLESPGIDVLLAGVDKRPEVSLGELLAFMNAYNFRFGSANTSAQRKAYSDLYPALVKLRTEATEGVQGVAAADTPAPPAPDRTRHPQEFFEKMEYEHVAPKAVPKN